MKRFTDRFMFPVLAVVMMAACSCSEKTESENSGGFENPAGNVEVSFSANQNDILHNPLNGWVMYVSGSADPSYFDKEIYLSEVGENVRVRDYASACYIRTGWKSLNPSDGVYSWDIPGDPIYELVKAAEERGLPIAFRVVVDGRDQRENTPQFVFDAGAEYWLSDTKYPDRKTPLAVDPIWRQYYEKFIEAFGERFDNPETTAFIDGYGLGKWGEGHNVCYEQNNAITDKTEEYKQDTMEWITKLYAENFTEVPLVINYHRHLGHPVSDGSEASPNTEKLLNIAISNGYCLRSDAFGMNDPGWGYTDWEKAFVRNWNYKLPVIMEGGYIVSSHSYWNDPAGYRKGYPGDVRQGEYDASKEAKVNMMDFRVGDETESWFTDAFNLVKKFNSEGGYRLYPDRISVPETVSSGGEATIVSRWRNIGWGYFPNNIRQWNYKYKVAFALLDSEGNAVQTFVDSNCEPSSWVSGSPSTYTFKTKVGASAGKYTWAVAIVDTTKDNAPAIEPAVNSDKKTESGWVKISEVTVN